MPFRFLKHLEHAVFDLDAGARITITNTSGAPADVFVDRPEGAVWTPFKGPVRLQAGERWTVEAREVGRERVRVIPTGRADAGAIVQVEH